MPELHVAQECEGSMKHPQYPDCAKGCGPATVFVERRADGSEVYRCTGCSVHVRTPPAEVPPRKPMFPTSPLSTDDFCEIMEAVYRAMRANDYRRH